MNELEEIKKRKLKEMIERSQYPDSPIEVNGKNFDSMVSKYSLLIIDCGADWCAPCRMIDPIIDKLAKEYKGKIVFGKLDVGVNKAIAIKFGVMGIPTLLVFRKGKLVDRIVGFRPKESLDSMLKQLLEE